jgi:hypothetical protein
VIVVPRTEEKGPQISGNPGVLGFQRENQLSPLAWLVLGLHWTMNLNIHLLPMMSPVSLVL